MRETYEDEDELLDDRKKYLSKFPPEWKGEPETKHFDLRDFKKLKVIVKIASFELTPAKPNYPGGSWHVEGTATRI